MGAKTQVKPVLNSIFIVYNQSHMYLNSPHAEALACQLILPPPCPSMSTGEKQDQLVPDFHQIFNETLREAECTYRYLVFIVEKHVNSFLTTEI